jgi:alcohol dehydrogenase class IV
LTGDFTWRDAGRTVVFRRGGVGAAVEILREQGVAEFELLSTKRALAGGQALAAAASRVHEVEPGQVPVAAGALVDAIGDGSLVALGGGRVIDVAKALAAVSGAEVAAIPTTMSGAEMTAIHRLPEGAEQRARGMVRPRLVIADPEAMTSALEAELRASSMNALAHGADTLCTPLSNPVSEMTALRGAELIGRALDQEREERDRAALALGSILCGYAIDSAGLGLHHVVCQTLVRVCGTPHAETNAAILPKALSLLAERAPGPYERLAVALGTDLADLPERVEELGRPQPLGELGGDESKLDEAVEAMLQRPELSHVPGSVSYDELVALARGAW